MSNIPTGENREDIKMTFLRPYESMVFVNKMLPTEKLKKLIEPISAIAYGSAQIRFKSVVQLLREVSESQSIK